MTPMLRLTIRGLFGLCLALVLGACDRSDLGEDGPPIPPDPDPPGAANSCSAHVGEEVVVASVISASESDDGTVLDLSCRSNDVRFLIQVKPDGFGPDTLALGVPGNRAQYSVGENATVTVDLPGGEEGGEIVLDTYTRDRVVGTFWFSAPGFEENDPLIRVTEGAFDIEVE